MWFTACRTGAIRPKQVIHPQSVPVMVGSTCTFNKTSTTRSCLTSGSFSSGTPYYICRILLYCDDFTPCSIIFPKCSVGLLYAPYRDVNAEETNMLLRSNSLCYSSWGVDQLRNLRNHWRPSTNSNERCCRHWLERKEMHCVHQSFRFRCWLSGMESSVFLGVISHAANTTFIHCTNRILERPHIHSASYHPHPKSIHSSNTLFLRGLVRTEPFLRSQISKEDCVLKLLNEGSYHDV